MRYYSLHSYRYYTYCQGTKDTNIGVILISRSDSVPLLSYEIANAIIRRHDRDCEDIKLDIDSIVDLTFNLN